MDGPTYTIQYEFACYLLVIGLGMVGLLRRPAITASVAIVKLAIASQLPMDALQQAWLPLLFAVPQSTLLRLVGVFLAGTSFYALRDLLLLDGWTVAGALIGLCATLLVPAPASVSIGLFGSF